MFKRTKGYLLLTLLVLTGLAGRLHTDVLPGKERRQLVQELKVSKNSLLSTIKDLNTRQLEYRPSRQEKSIKQCIYELVLLEETLWYLTQSSLHSKNFQAPIQSSTDLHAAASTCMAAITRYKKWPYRNIDEAMDCFRKARAEQLVYVKTTTDNPVKFQVHTPAGAMTACQAIHLNAALSKEYTRQIRDIMANPNYPK